MKELFVRQDAAGIGAQRPEFDAFDAVRGLLDEASVPYTDYVPASVPWRRLLVHHEYRAIVATLLSERLGDGWSVAPGSGGRTPVTNPAKGVPRVFVTRTTDDGGLLEEQLARAAACELTFTSSGVSEALVGAYGVTPWGHVLPSDEVSSALLPAWAEAQTVTFPIDIVYTWVDDQDEAWLARRDRALRDRGRSAPPSSTDAARFRNRDELRYSLRSVEMFAPWIRKVFIVTDQQRPGWLRPDQSRVEVIDHRDIFEDPSRLPTFNSHAIESQLHHIADLSEHFIYMNDDFLFARPVRPELFFDGNGTSRCFRSPAGIRPGCPAAGDHGVDAAAKNTRDILAARFGAPGPRQKFKHTPQPQLRSRLYALEDEFADEFRRTMSSQFRHYWDLSIPSSFAHHYGLLTGTAAPGVIRYDYIGLSDLGRSEERLTRLLEARDMDAICINDADTAPEDTERASRLLEDFFEAYYPWPSMFEHLVVAT